MNPSSQPTDSMAAEISPLARVLLVDDDATQLKLTFLCLRQAGFAIECASSAEEALLCVGRQRPDVIVSDVIMGGVDGFTLCRRVRERPALVSVPILLLSAHYGDEKDRELAIRVGAAALVQRSPGFSAELEALRSILREGHPSGPSGVGFDTSTYEDQLWSTNNRLYAAVADAQRAEERYRALFENATDLISVLTRDGVIIETNRRSEEILGLSPAEAIGRHIRDFAVSGGEEAHAAAYRETVERINDRRLVTIRRADGAIKQVEFSTNLVDLDGEPRLLSIGRDVTEKLRLEESLRQAQRMEAIGQLTGGIAHDFNNILSVIIANSHLLLDDLGESDPRREEVDEIRMAGDRAAALTRQLLAVSRKQILEPVVLDVNATVGGLEKMLGRLIGEDIDFKVLRGAAVGNVRADVGQLEQVVMNLVVNARDAMPRGGSLSIATSNVELAEAAARDLGLTSGSYVLLAVSDAGCGIDPETKKRIFEPFFTTKALGRGTGMGLATCQGIVNQSGGAISVESEVGRGSVFKVFLPRVDAQPRAARATKKQINVRGHETVLLVEDDESVRTSVRKALTSFGYKVVSVSHGAEALSVTKRRDSEIALILSDVVVPGLSGPEIVVEIQKRWPNARSLFMSGHTDHPIFRTEDLGANAAFIQKPFSPEALALKVRTVLDA